MLPHQKKINKYWTKDYFNTLKSILFTIQDSSIASGTTEAQHLQLYSSEETAVAMESREQRNIKLRDVSKAFDKFCLKD